MLLKRGFVAALLLLQACAHAPNKTEALPSPSAVLAQVCSTGRSVTHAEGMGWMKAKSKEASGQFEAAIRVQEGALSLEVLKPFGGTLANLTVNGGTYHVEVPGQPERNQSGSQNWGGIPLRWATDLFLGRIPCPEKLGEGASVSRTDDGIVARTDTDKFVYHMKDYRGQARPSRLSWTGSNGASVDFEFDEFEEGTGSPEKWQAVSHSDQIKFAWRERKIVP